jgi:hypothetical protein
MSLTEFSPYDFEGEPYSLAWFTVYGIRGFVKYLGTRYFIKIVPAIPDIPCLSYVGRPALTLTLSRSSSHELTGIDSILQPSEALLFELNGSLADFIQLDHGELGFVSALHRHCRHILQGFDQLDRMGLGHCDTSPESIQLNDQVSIITHLYEPDHVEAQLDRASFGNRVVNMVAVYNPGIIHDLLVLMRSLVWHDVGVLGDGPASPYNSPLRHD